MSGDDDEVTFDEMIAFANGIMGDDGPVPEEFYPEIRAEFDKIDTDKSETISFEEAMEFQETQ